MKELCYKVAIIILIFNTNILVQVSNLLSAYQSNRTPIKDKDYVRVRMLCAPSSTSVPALPSWSIPPDRTTTSTSPNITMTTSTPSSANLRWLQTVDCHHQLRSHLGRSFTAVSVPATRGWTGSRTGRCFPGTPSRGNLGTPSFTGWPHPHPLLSSINVTVLQ